MESNLQTVKVLVPALRWLYTRWLGARASVAPPARRRGSWSHKPRHLSPAVAPQFEGEDKHQADLADLIGLLCWKHGDDPAKP